MSITLLIIIATVVVSFSAFNNTSLFDRLKFNPYQIHHRKEWYRFLGHALLHGDWMHLLVNMYVFYIFGGLTERIFQSVMGTMKGGLYFLLLYVGGVLFATLPAYKKHCDNHYYNSVGASGAVSAILFASIVLLPTNSIYLFFIPIPIPAFIFGALYLAYEHYMDKRSQDNVAHDAHFWGALFGVLLTIIVVPNSFVNFVNQVIDFF
jgi:membrane associated rhomboid family serine protease